MGFLIVWTESISRILYRFCPPEVVAESSIPSLSRDCSPSTSLRMLGFAAACGRQNRRRSFIWAGNYLQARAAPHRRKAPVIRPCTGVRIWSLHSCLAAGVFHKGIRGLSTLAFLWSPLISRCMGVTQYLSAVLTGGLCSDFPPHGCPKSDRLTRSGRIIQYIYMHVFVDEFLDKSACAVY